MSEIRKRVFVSGLVQGVAFRAYTQQAAKRAGVTGHVRNLPDGRVEAVFEGEPSRVESMVDWCRQGPPSSRVENVEVQDEPATGEFRDFEVTFVRGAL